MKKTFAEVGKSGKLSLCLFVFLLTFGYALLQGGFVSWFLFYSFLPFAFYCFLLAFYPLKDFEVVRVLPKSEYYSGEPVKVCVTLRRRHFFPLFYLSVADQLVSPLKDSPRVLLFPGFRKEYSIEYSIEELKRGEYVFQSFLLRTGDPLGLTEKELELPLENRFIVFPACEELLYRPIEQQYDQGMTASRERVQRDTSMAVSVREYHPGDRFSWINWKASAKRNEMMTKEFEQKHSHDVMVIMDCAHDSRFEAIVSFTASFLKAVLKKGAQAGLSTYGRERAVFPIRGGEKHLQEMFYHLAKVEGLARQPFEKVLEARQLPMQQTVSIFLITAGLTKGLIKRTSFLGNRKGTITIYVLRKPGEFLTDEEKKLASMAAARGVRLLLIHEGNFTEAFSGGGGFSNG